MKRNGTHYTASSKRPPRVDSIRSLKGRSRKKALFCNRDKENLEFLPFRQSYLTKKRPAALEEGTVGAISTVYGTALPPFMIFFVFSFLSLFLLSLPPKSRIFYVKVYTKYVLRFITYQKYVRGCHTRGGK